MDDFERQAAPERTPEGLTPVLAPLGVATGGVASGVVDRANGLTTAHLVQGGNGAFTRWLDQRGQANDPVLQPVTVDPITMRPVAFEADEQTADAWPSLGTVEISATRWGPLDEVVSAVLEHVATALSPGVERERAEARAKVAIAEILRACAQQRLHNVRHVAYVLATAYHESKFIGAGTEKRNGFTRVGDQWVATTHTTPARTVTVPATATPQEREQAYWNAAYGQPRNSLGNRPATADAMNFRGRGYVQLTGRYNYEQMTKRLTELGYSYTHNGVTYGGAGNPPINLVQHPAHVNDVPELAARILVLGSAEGRFRAGHSLGSHIHEDVADPEQVREEYIGARGVINGGRDRAEDIAGYAQGFEAVLAPLWPSVVPKPRSNHR